MVAIASTGASGIATRVARRAFSSASATWARAPECIGEAARVLDPGAVGGSDLRKRDLGRRRAQRLRARLGAGEIDRARAELAGRRVFGRESQQIERPQAEPGEGYADAGG